MSLLDELKDGASNAWHWVRNHVWSENSPPVSPAAAALPKKIQDPPKLAAPDTKPQLPKIEYVPNLVPLHRPRTRVARFELAIAAGESGQGNLGYVDHGAVGPPCRSHYDPRQGKELSAYGLGHVQMMGDNVEKWSKKYLGRLVTAADFLKNPEEQRRVSHAKFSAYFAQGLSNVDAAVKWHAGDRLTMKKVLKKKKTLGDGIISTVHYARRVASYMRVLKRMKRLTDAEYFATIKRMREATEVAKAKHKGLLTEKQLIALIPHAPQRTFLASAKETPKVRAHTKHPHQILLAETSHPVKPRSNDEHRSRHQILRRASAEAQPMHQLTHTAPQQQAKKSALHRDIASAVHQPAPAG